MGAMTRNPLVSPCIQWERRNAIRFSGKPRAMDGILLERKAFDASSGSAKAEQVS
jgi:hypothetical protein